MPAQMGFAHLARPRMGQPMGPGPMGPMQMQPPAPSPQVAGALQGSVGQQPQASGMPDLASLLKTHGVPHYANGTPWHYGGPAVVGEKGPELVNLPQGASVTPNAKAGLRTFGANAGARAGTANTSLAQGAINKGAGMGYLDPSGSPQLRASMERQTLRSSQDRLHQGQTLASLVGLNPYAAQRAEYNIGQENAGQTADALNDAHAKELFSNRDFVRRLLEGRLNNEDEVAMMKLRAKMEEDARGNPITAALGQIAGRAAGAFIPGMGGGGGGVRPAKQYDPDRPWLGSY